MFDYDAAAELYCTKDAPARPLCMSVGMDERVERDRYSTNEEYYEARDIAYDAWDEWKKGREVAQNGICDNYMDVKK